MLGYDGDNPSVTVRVNINMNAEMVPILQIEQWKQF